MNASTVTLHSVPVTARVIADYFLAALALKVQYHRQEEKFMLHWSLTFLIIALIAALLGFAGLAGAAAGIAKILFFVFLVLWLVSFLTRRTI